ARPRCAPRQGAPARPRAAPAPPSPRPRPVRRCRPAARGGPRASGTDPSRPATSSGARPRW
ncbi:MAG TPA: RNA polymerase, partial [Myxococcales bacterium]|nr:RNA polymerase [Myxococcales bacterium]